MCKTNDIPKMITLVENSCGAEGCTAEHGLSVYIETARHKLLMDTGQTDAMVKNAAKLGIDLSAVDTVILSHGHYDHSGGILPFYALNQSADIIMQRTAAEPHYNGEKYIGIDKNAAALPTVRLVDDDIRLDDELFLFSGISGRRCYPQGNLRLSRLVNGEKIPDDFAHEQCLVITQGGKNFLLSGCAHNGILNILDRYADIFGSLPDCVISGFHMVKKSGEYTAGERKVITDTAKELAKTGITFYTGHCTGIPAFEIMKEIMGDKLNALHSGEKIF